MATRAATVCTVLALFPFLLRPAEARQSNSAPENPVWYGEPGIVRTVADIMASTRPQDPVPRIRSRTKLRLPTPANATGPAFSAQPRVAAALPQPLSPQTVDTSFLAVQLSEAPFFPPDSMGAVGLNQFLVAVNGRLKVFDKGGTTVALNADLDTFFGSVLPLGSQGTSDPRVRFDRLTNRWFITCVSVDLPNRVLIAVSGDQSGTKTIGATTDFTFFYFQHDLVGTTPNTDTGGFADYDTLGIDANALYIGANIFDSSLTTYLGSTGWVVQKSSLLSGGPIAVTAFRQIASSSGAGAVTPQGVDNDDPSATQGFFIGYDGNLQVRRVSNPGGTPSITGNLTVSGVPATQPPLPVPASGSTKPLDPVGNRLMMAHIYGGSLWTTHAINVNSSGVATTSGGTIGRTGSRWYQIGNLSAAPSLSQSGTVFDSQVVSSGTARHYWIPSLAVSGQGHMAIGFSAAAPSNSAGTQLQPSVGVSGRLASDPPGTTQAVTIAQPGLSTYNPKYGTPATVKNPQRWGDFSYTSVDPTDNMTMWTVQEYCNATDSWGVQVIRLKAPPPASPASASPNIVGPGTPSVMVVITGTSSAGSGFFEPGASFPNHFTASVTGGITLNGVTVNDSTHVTLDLNVPPVAVGSRDITLTNPDGQSVVFSGGISVESGSQPKVLSVNSSSSNGTYGVGAVIPITVTFNMAVNVTGTPQLTLETGAVNEVLNYISGSGTATLNFGYSVAAGDTSPDLDCVSTNSLALNGGDVRSVGFVEADLTLPVPGGVGSLGANKNLVIDTSPPDTTINSTPASLSNTTSAVFTFSSSDPVGATFEVNIDGAGFVANGASTTVTYTGLSQGAHTFQVRAADAASPKNVDPTPASFAWTIDSVPPDTQITGQPPDPDTNLTPTFNYTSTEAGATFEYRVDGGAWTSTGTTGSVTLPSLVDGSHTFEVRSTDVVGNVDPTPAQYTWYIGIPPATPGSSSGHKKKGCGLLGLDALAFAALIAAVRRTRRDGRR